MDQNRRIRKQLSANFYQDEFECNCGCGLYVPNPRLIDLLQEMRTDLGQPLWITSGTRCESFNSTLKRASKTSQHIFGAAVDVYCVNPDLRRRIVRLALDRFPSVGIAKGFIHLGLDLPTRLFTYAD